jgi:mannosylglycerate hydrolase
MPRRVDLVPHTHWDREWHTPFQTFRLRLVDLVDRLLDQLEADPSYAHFLLDGQMAVVDDYLAVRPEAEARLRRLAGAGRVAVGPWYALPDEFLVSGETLVRNLQHGLRTAARFGGAMEVGYLPDMFGHVAQMPQLLRALGFEHAVVWRGVPAAVDRSAFWWTSPDGSTVRAEYLPAGYGNGARLPDDAKALLRRIAEFEAEQRSVLRGPILWMNGTDHLLPQPWLGRVVAEANALEAGYELRICSLEEHLRTAPTDDLPRWTGELRSSARANLLMGVASNRVDVKQAAARAERALERLAEPLSALLLPAEHWPATLLEAAWVEVLRNSAHDSVCACSVDEVCDAVLHRYAEARQIGAGLADRALQALGATIPGDGPVIVNPAARRRGGVVELRLPGSSVPAGCQLVSARPPERVLMEDAAAEVATVTVAELEHFPGIRSFAIEAGDGGELLHAVRDDAGTLVGPAVRTALAALREERAGRPLRVRVTNEAAVTVLARVDDVPGFGWRSWGGSGAPVAPVEARPLRLSNGSVEVQVDPTDGTFSLDGLSGLGRLVDGGDVGDTYNWCPPADDVVVDRPLSSSCRLVEHGPVRGRLEVRSTYALPTHVDGARRVGSQQVQVRTTLELRAGEDVVRVRVELDNHGLRDHRLRVHLPLPRPSATSTAECAFAVVERGLTAEGGPTEQAVPTFPSRRFVTAGGLTVVHEGLLEYELVDVDGGGADGPPAAATLAVTLLRCTGMLSQGPMATRPLPAGPVTPMEGPQMQGPVAVSFALHVGGRDPYAVADDALLPLLVTAAGGGTGPADGQALDVAGAEVSAVVRDGGALHVRLFNPSPDPATVRVPGRRGWLVDLRGRPLSAFEGSFQLGPWAIATAALT